jgi:leucine dehydrogenase
MIYDHPDFNHREIHFHEDKATGLRAIIAIHSAWQRPSVGGCRVRDYLTEAEALQDVLRLSRGMTYKSAMAGLDYGGAKAVIVGTPQPDARKDVLRSMADFVNRLGGRFRTGVDVGLNADDIEIMSERSPYIAGTGAIAADELTAQGVMFAIAAAARFRFDRAGLDGLSVSILGLGKVGGRLAELLHQQGVQVSGADLDPGRAAAAAEIGIRIVSAEEALRQPCDIFAPCALGGILNGQTIPQLACAIVAGAANNQFASNADADLLSARGILYAPDYITNAGGLIAVAMQLDGEDEKWASEKLEALGASVSAVFELARDEGISSHAAAERIAGNRISRLNELALDHNDLRSFAAQGSNWKQGI